MSNQLNKAEFFRCDLAGKDFSKANIEGALFDGIDLRNINLPQNLTEVNLNNCDLSGKDFSNSKLENTNFKKSNLKGAILTNNLSTTNLEQIEYDKQSKFPPLENLDNGFLLNLLKQTIDLDISIKESGASATRACSRQ